MSKFYYVYILKCFDDRFYVGCTDNLRARLARHTRGQIAATRNKLSISLYSYFAFSNKYTAFNFEKYLKSGSGRAFMKKHLVH